MFTPIISTPLFVCHLFQCAPSPRSATFLSPPFSSHFKYGSKGAFLPSEVLHLWSEFCWTSSLSATALHCQLPHHILYLQSPQGIFYLHNQSIWHSHVLLLATHREQPESQKWLLNWIERPLLLLHLWCGKTSQMERHHSLFSDIPKAQGTDQRGQVGTKLEICEMSCLEHGQGRTGTGVYACVLICMHTPVCIQRLQQDCWWRGRTGERRQGPWRIYSSLYVLNKETEGFNSSPSNCPFELQFLTNIEHLKLHKIQQIIWRATKRRISINNNWQ